jgi:hypothetical protein
MPKTILAKSEINKDIGLSIVKAFRITNKRAGEAKRKGPEGNEEYLQFCAHLRDLAEKADQQNFKIWVNNDGTTGHTYEKDYKETPEESNNYESHKQFVEAFLARQASILQENAALGSRIANILNVPENTDIDGELDE